MAQYGYCIDQLAERTYMRGIFFRWSSRLHQRGGGLITMPALMSLGVPVHLIAGINQCSAVIGNISSFLSYAHSGKVHFRSGLIAGITAVVGASLGAKLNMIVPENLLRIIMIALIPVMALVVLLNKKLGETDRSDTLSAARIFIFSCCIGLGVGAYQGFYGAGAGTLFIIAFAVIMRLDLIKASGTAKLVSMCAAISSALTYAVSGLVIWRVALIATAFSIAGNCIGSALAIKNGAKTIRPFMIGVIALLFLKLVFGW